MQITKSTNNIAPLITTIIGCGVFSLAYGPLFLIISPIIFLLAKWAMGKDVDELTEKDTEEIIEKAREKRRPGQQSVTIRQTIPSNGALVDLPMTRKWKVTFDDE